MGLPKEPDVGLGDDGEPGGGPAARPALCPIAPFPRVLSSGCTGGTNTCVHLRSGPHVAEFVAHGSQSRICMSPHGTHLISTPTRQGGCRRHPHFSEKTGGQGA